MGYIVYRALVVFKLDVVMHELELSEEEIRNILIAHHIVFLYKGQVKIADKDMTNNRLTPEQRRYYEAAKIDLFESGKYGKFTLITDALVVETMEKDMYSFLKHNRNCQLWVIDYAGLAKSRPITKYILYNYLAHYCCYKFPSNITHLNHTWIKNSKTL